MTEAWIIDACRTPRGIGRVGKGALAELHPQQLASTVLKALADRNAINTAEVDDVIWGVSSQRGRQSMDLGRMAALDAGYDVRSSGVTIDRFCGSGISTVNFAASTVMSGMSDLVVAGGFDDMTSDAITGFGDMAATADTEMMRAKGISDSKISRANDRRRLGFLEAQGGGTILLARGDLALKMGLPVLAVVGYAQSFADGVHTSIPAPGLGALGAGRGGRDRANDMGAWTAATSR